jgi:hypothetical protein
MWEDTRVPRTAHPSATVPTLMADKMSSVSVGTAALPQRAKSLGGLGVGPRYLGSRPG